jgi:hypothetical protein
LVCVDFEKIQSDGDMVDGTGVNVFGFFGHKFISIRRIFKPGTVLERPFRVIISKMVKNQDEKF